MLQLILGTAGTGKTTTMLNTAIEYAKDEKECLIIVPEQFSFAIEQKLLDFTNGLQTDKITVLSFNRLCENIFNIYGGVCGKSLNDTAKLILMKLSLQQVKDEFCVYGELQDKNSFITTMTNTIDELKACGTYPNEIEKVISQTNDEQLAKKLSDIKLLYSVYQSMIEQNYKDPLDDLSRAIKLDEINDFFKGKNIFIDSFDYFSPPQKRMLEIMINSSDDVYLSLCSDNININDFDIFLLMKQTAKWFIETGKKALQTVKVPIILNENYRAKSQQLKSIGEMLKGTKITKTTSDDISINITECENVYDELMYIASEIKRLVRKENYRYKDIALITRNLDDNSAILETVFKIYDIPVFFSKKEKVTSQPLFSCVKTIAEIVSKGFTTEGILRLARNPALNISQNEYSNFENYCYIWNINGRQLKLPFLNSPKGLQSELSEEDAETLLSIENTRKKIIEPLQEFLNEIKISDGISFTEAVFNYITNISLIENISNYYYNIHNQNTEDKYYKEAIQNSANMYNLLMDILDLFSDIIGKTYLDKKELCEIFINAIDTLEVGNIPNTLDCVVAGSADISRFDSPKITFAFGLNSGIFPQKLSYKGVFTKNEQDELINMGIEINLNPFQKAIIEKMYLYTAITSPQEKLYLSYCLSTLTGTTLEPSLIIEQTQKTLRIKKINSDKISSTHYVYDIFTLRNQYVKLKSRQIDCYTELYMLQKLNDKKFIDSVEDIFNEKLAQNILPETAKRLIGNEMNLSPTKIEKFYTCPFMFFTENMLKIKKREKAEYNPLITGNAMHFVLDKIINDIGYKNIIDLNETRLKEKIIDSLTDYIKSITTKDSIEDTRFNYNVERLSNMLYIIIERIGREFKESDFVPVGTEVKVAKFCKIEPISVNIDGTIINVNGSIDRIDIAKIDGKNYARVTDYKSGDKTFSLNEVFYGLNMQMLIYLFALCDDQKNPYGELKPAGILYSPINVKPIDSINDLDDVSSKAVMDKNLLPNGLIVNDILILNAMEHGIGGKFIPVSLNKNGTPKKTNTTISKKALDYVKEAVYEKIETMGKNILDGNILPNPIKKNMRFACDYCPNAVLCKNKYKKVYKDITYTNAEMEIIQSLDDNEEENS